MNLRRASLALSLCVALCCAHVADSPPNSELTETDSSTPQDEPDKLSEQPKRTPGADERFDSSPEQEYAFTETISHNSGLSDGFVDSGQTIVLTLIDNAASEFEDAVHNAEVSNQAEISSNTSDTQFEYKVQANVIINDSALHLQNDILNEPQIEELNNSKSLKIEEVVNVTSDIPVISDDLLNINEEAKAERNITDNDSSKKTIESKSEEVQEEIPSFSEWAQKQLEEAEKNKESVLNDSSKLIHKTSSSNTNLKVRSKNYASPDCGAKIVAANPEAGSANFILTSSRDEYMLNTCNSRIWFIVELCEAIQAKKIDLANFELFSSTPKNFSVSVSDRFPTRDWAGVGQFIAQDERDVQTFNLHPHLFGKFIKVEVHSRYGSEHYCPISLFRVYGTSEFEVFETENSPQSHINPDNDDDDDDEIIEELSEADKNTDSSKNLFGSARDAVMSIMKRAAEALVKSSDSKNSTSSLEINTDTVKNCKTPSHIIVCDNCSNSLFMEVYELLSCDGEYIKTLVESPIVFNALYNSDMCQSYGLDFKTKDIELPKTEFGHYISAFLMPSYVAALCNMLAVMEKKVLLNTSHETNLNITSNLTIDKKHQTLNKSGAFNKLLQEPFTNCGGKKHCESHDFNDLNQDSIKSKKSETVDSENDILLDINPTKTYTINENIVEPSTVVDISVENVTESNQRKDFKTENNTTFKQTNEINLIEGEISNASVDTSQDSSLKNDSQFLEEIQQVDTSNSSISENLTTTENSVTESPNITVNNAEDLNTSQEQLALDNLLSDFDQGIESSTPMPVQNTISTSQGQKESVFLRLSNRIKALEKNMSLSGQYLEELSRRYKKQVEEIQKTYEKTLSIISEENKRAEERDQKNKEELLLLQQQIAQLSSSLNILLSEGDSWFGSVTIWKIIFFQIIASIIIVYIFRNNNPDNMKFDNPKQEAIIPGKIKIRRNSDEGVVRFTDKDILNKKSNSEESLSQVMNSAKANICSIKNERKKKRKKSSLINRSASIAGTLELEHGKIHDPLIKEENKDEPWLTSGINSGSGDTPIALEEAEFIIPENSPVDFNIGEDQISKINTTPKKEFPKTNGSIVGAKSWKPQKMRRLSSPAFFKTSVSKQNIKSEENVLLMGKNIDPETDYLPLNLSLKDCKKEPNTNTDFESSTLNEWPSYSELSQSSISTTTTNSSVKVKKPKKNSFKNMLKKVF